MYCVQISARVIRWPHVCACCCRGADTYVEVSSTRTWGKRVVHTHTRGWDVPYCERCLAHIQADRRLDAHSMFVLHQSVLLGLGAGLLALLVFLIALVKSPLLAVILGGLAVFGAAAAV